jgi:putative ABC transport system permease protein
MAAQAFGWTAEEAIGKRIEVNESQNGTVIGVTEDFHFKSLHDPIQPLVTIVPRTRMEYFLLRIHTADVPAAIASIQSDWERIAPELPFNFAFINEAVDQRYQADERFLQHPGHFTGLDGTVRSDRYHG